MILFMVLVFSIFSRLFLFWMRVCLWWINFWFFLVGCNVRVLWILFLSCLMVVLVGVFGNCSGCGMFMEGDMMMRFMIGWLELGEVVGLGCVGRVFGFEVMLEGYVICYFEGEWMSFWLGGRVIRCRGIRVYNFFFVVCWEC